MNTQSIAPPLPPATQIKKSSLLKTKKKKKARMSTENEAHKEINTLQIRDTIQRMALSPSSRELLL